MKNNHVKCRFLTAFLVSFIIAFGCIQKEPAEIPAEIPEPEPEVPLEMEELTFGDFEALPEWLQEEILFYKATPMVVFTGGYFRAEKGEWENRTIYNLYRAELSIFLNLREENGEKIDPSLNIAVKEASENWTWVYEWAKGYMCSIFGNGAGSLSGPRAKSVEVFASN